jgi:hypothetical protein
MMHHKILHQTMGGVLRDTTRVLSLRLVQIVAHSVTHTITHSIIHHYYCIYCYFYGDYCNYCYCAPPAPPAHAPPPPDTCHLTASRLAPHRRLWRVQVDAQPLGLGGREMNKNYAASQIVSKNI